MSDDVIYLPEAWRTLGTGRFSEMLRDELEALSVEQLPLQQCMTQGSHVPEQRMQVAILGMKDAGADMHIRIGVFFNSIVAGCSCADDPTPIEPLSEYCELLLRMDKRSGYVVVTQPDS
jgi:hypothetical protein